MPFDRINLKTIEALPPWEWPEEARDVVADALRDRTREADDRLLAARLAGDLVIMDDGLAALLLETLRDSSEADELRAASAIALGPALEMSVMDEFDDPDEQPLTEGMFRTIVDALNTLYTDAAAPKLVRRHVLEASVRDPQEWHVDAVRSAYYSDDPEWKLTAVFAMEWVRGFDDEILEALESPDENIRFEAVRAAGSNVLDRAWPFLVDIIESDNPDKDLLIAAIEAAPNIRPREAGMLVSDWASSDDEDVADAAEEAIMIAEMISGTGFHGQNGEDLLW